MDHRLLQNYVFGFAVSVALTFIAFGLTQWHLMSTHEFPPHSFLVPALTALALIQLLVQLVLFLHVGREEKPRLNLLMLLCAGVVVSILVGGTLWIMHNLSHMQGQPSVPFIGNDVTPQAEDD
ncbi:MAG TPA: cytochrome C oxidase subunit IV family protein [Candidatus Paceibacterota bacterium]|nr:cytochrome C oxidase subunit IV family protein [Candidatus Paceibacterota bacterium]